MAATVTTCRVESLRQSTDDSAHWLRFLSRWAAAMGLAGLALIVVFVGGIGVAPADTAKGPEYMELMQAVRSPVLYRVAMLFDALGWALMSGTLVTLAVILRRHAPIRSTLTAACALGLVSGVLGGFMRLIGVSHLARLYTSATPDQQISLLQAYLVLREDVIGAHFAAGNVLAGAAYVLVAWSVLSLAGFPRWLALWLAITGILQLTLFALAAIGAFSFPFVLLTVLVLIGANFALARTLWNPPSILISALVSVSAQETQ